MLATLLLLTAAQPAPVKPEPALVAAVCELAARNLDAAYRCLELMADDRTSWVFEAQEMANWTTAAVREAKDIRKLLEAVAAVKGLSKQELDAIERLQKVAEWVKEIGESLQRFRDTGVADHYNAADKAAIIVRHELDAILERNQKTGTAPAPRESAKRP